MVWLRIEQMLLQQLPENKVRINIVWFMYYEFHVYDALNTCVVGRIMSKAIHRRKKPTSGPKAINK